MREKGHHMQATTSMKERTSLMMMRVVRIHVVTSGPGRKMGNGEAGQVQEWREVNGRGHVEVAARAVVVVLEAKIVREEECRSQSGLTGREPSTVMDTFGESPADSLSTFTAHTAPARNPSLSRLDIAGGGTHPRDLLNANTNDCLLDFTLFHLFSPQGVWT